DREALLGRRHRDVQAAGCRAECELRRRLRRLLPKAPRALILYQVNMQNWYGGGEVYTSFFSRALEALGVPSVLFAHPEARHWQDALPSGTKVVALPPETLRTHFASLRNAQVVFHSVADPATVGVLH